MGKDINKKRRVTGKQCVFIHVCIHIYQIDRLKDSTLWVEIGKFKRGLLKDLKDS